jgi:uncharacterized protein YegP (UPF0339 family)
MIKRIIEVYESEDGWRVRILAANGKIVHSSEAYASKAKAIRAASREQKLYSAGISEVKLTV